MTCLFVLSLFVVVEEEECILGFFFQAEDGIRDHCVTGVQTCAFRSSFSTISDLFTLFSKSFSSFLHSTCLLSVSHPYLALEDSYLPLRAAVPSNPTLVGATCFERTLHGAFTLSGVRFDVLKRSRVFRRSWLQFEDSLNLRFQFRALTGSVALTKVIFVNFFSSA